MTIIKKYSTSERRSMKKRANKKFDNKLSMKVAQCCVKHYMQMRRQDPNVENSTFLNPSLWKCLQTSISSSSHSKFVFFIVFCVNYMSSFIVMLCRRAVFLSTNWLWSKYRRCHFISKDKDICIPLLIFCKCKISATHSSFIHYMLNQTDP